jgi:hypothetical protein
LVHNVKIIEERRGSSSHAVRKTRVANTGCGASDTPEFRGSRQEKIPEGITKRQRAGFSDVEI